MTVLSRRALVSGCCSCAALALMGCAATGETQALAPGYKPPKETDEGGLWQMVERQEKDIRHSRHLIADPEANAYLREIACRLAGDHCPDLRLYVLRTPLFNASMAPNGMMQVWSGLLLRTRNEAQLAAVLGHEIGHYLQRHSLQRYRDAVVKANFGTFLSLGLAVAGAPPGSAQLTQMVMLASMFAYSREMEREADDIALTLMAKAGYPPIEASKIWEQLIAERSADPNNESGGGILFASHPAAEERAAVLRQKAGEMSGAGRDTRAEVYRQRLRGIRRILFDDEIRLRQFPRTLVLLDQLSAELPPDADLLHTYGELYRLRGEAGDTGRAIDYYERAIAAGDCPHESWRGLGLALREAGQRSRADEALIQYLRLAPHAPDRALIESYVSGGMS